MQQQTLIKFRGKELLPTKLKRETFGYKIYQVTPSRFIESGKSLESILDTISAIHEGKVKYDYLNKAVIINQSSPIYYEILFEGKSILFNYAIPDKYSDVLSKKIDSVFRVAAVKEVDDYFHNFENKYYCTFAQKKHFMFSLNSNTTDSGLLENLLSVINSVLPEDKVLLQVAISPLNDKWKEDWAKANIKHKNGEELVIHPSAIIAGIESIIGGVESLFDILDIVVGVDKKEKDAYAKKGKLVERWGGNMYRNSHMSTQKVNGNGFETQIRVYCTSEERTRYYQKIFSGVFKILDAEQELEFTKIERHKGKVREFNSHLTSKNIFCTKELVGFIRLPDRRMQMDFKSAMKSIEVTENIIPEQLLDSNSVPIGQATYKGTKIQTYFPTEVSMKAMCRIISGPSRAGKTTLLKNMVISAIKSGDSCVVFDTIRNCELVQDIRDYMPPEYKDRIVILDYSNLNYILPLAFNELLDVDFKDKISQMMTASHLTGALVGYINSVSSIDDQLSSRMRKYISCSGKLVMSQKGSTIKDVFEVLEDFNTRERFIKSSGLNENSTIIQELRHLDDGKGGTNYSLISGVIDRMSTILNDYASEVLLSTPSNPEINFTKWSLEGKVILIKMSDEVFSREALAPLVTFLFFKIWLSIGTARSKIDNPRMTQVFIDEIHNYPIILSFLSDKVKEAAKFKLNFTLTSHFLSDMKRLLPTLKAVGANFMMLGGSSRENYKFLEPEFLQHDISLEEAMQTKPFHSLNLINYNRQYTAYTSKMPSMLNKYYKKYDRSGMDLEHSKKYGTPFEG